MSALAEPKLKAKPHNYMWLSVAGGEANNLSYGTAVKPKLGAGADLGVGYELQLGGFMLGIGLEANYQLQRDAMETYLQAYDRLDKESEPVQYGYFHQQYMQNDRVLRLTTPVYVGGRIGDYAYLLVGASVSLPLWNRYQVSTQMLTQGQYLWSIDPVRTQGINDFSSYGYYANSEYKWENTYKDYMAVHVRAEIGGFIPVPKAKKFQLRAAVYGSYGIRMGNLGNKSLLDISLVDVNPYTQTEANLKQNVRWDALNQSSIYNKLPHNLEVGLKLTALFNVDVSHVPCRCLK